MTTPPHGSAATGPSRSHLANRSWRGWVRHPVACLKAVGAGLFLVVGQATGATLTPIDTGSGLGAVNEVLASNDGSTLLVAGTPLVGANQIPSVAVLHPGVTKPVVLDSGRRLGSLIGITPDGSVVAWAASRTRFVVAKADGSERYTIAVRYPSAGRLVPNGDLLIGSFATGSSRRATIGRARFGSTKIHRLRTCSEDLIYVDGSCSLVGDPGFGQVWKGNRLFVQGRWHGKRRSILVKGAGPTRAASPFRDVVYTSLSPDGRFAVGFSGPGPTWIADLARGRGRVIRSFKLPDYFNGSAPGVSWASDGVTVGFTVRRNNAVPAAGRLNAETGRVRLVQLRAGGSVGEGLGFTAVGSDYLVRVQTPSGPTVLSVNGRGAVVTIEEPTAAPNFGDFRYTPDRSRVIIRPLNGKVGATSFAPLWISTDPIGGALLTFPSL